MMLPAPRRGLAQVLLLLLVQPSWPSPIHRAAESGDLEALRAVADGREATIAAILDEADSDHYTALHLAAGMGHVAFVSALLGLGASALAIDENGENPLHLAAHVGRERVVRVLLDAGCARACASNEPSEGGCVSEEEAASCRVRLCDAASFTGYRA